MRSKTMCRAMSSAMLTGGLVLGLTGCGGSDGRTGICTVDCPVMPTGVLAAGGGLCNSERERIRRFDPGVRRGFGAECDADRDSDYTA
jgi:hypothetical protein